MGLVCFSTSIIDALDRKRTGLTPAMRPLFNGVPKLKINLPATRITWDQFTRAAAQPTTE
jgi:hypothetical protein